MDSRSGESFNVVEVPEDKRVNIGSFHLTGETDIWGNIVTNRLLGHDFIWSRFVKELSTPLRVAEWEPTCVRGAVAQSTSLPPIPEN